jgi:hypothetical protein
MHQSYSDRQPGGRWRFAGMVGLAVLACLLVAPATAWANSQQTTLARSGGVQLPAGDLIVRVLDLTVPADQPAVTHMHGAGFTYAVAGAHVFTAGGNETVSPRARPRGSALKSPTATARGPASPPTSGSSWSDPPPAGAHPRPGPTSRPASPASQRPFARLRLAPATWC